MQDAGDGFGNSSDVKMRHGAGVKDLADKNGAGAISKIANVIIKGNAIGTVASGDFLTFGIEAQQLGSIKVGNATVPLLIGAGSDLMGPGNTHGQAHPLGSTRGTTIVDDRIRLPRLRSRADLKLRLASAENVIHHRTARCPHRAVVGTPSTENSTDHFGFVAQQIGSFKAAGFTAQLTSGTDPAIELAPTTADMTPRSLNHEHHAGVPAS